MNYIRTLSLIIATLYLIACNNDVLKDFNEVSPASEEINNECMKDSLELDGNWNIKSYTQILQNDENVIYQTDRPNQPNYFPNSISGEIVFDQSNYSINLNLVLNRTMDSIENIKINDNGAYWYNSICNKERCIGLVRFFNIIQNQIRTDSLSQLCISELETPLLMWTKFESDSLLLYLSKKK